MGARVAAVYLVVGCLGLGCSNDVRVDGVFVVDGRTAFELPVEDGSVNAIWEGEAEAGGDQLFKFGEGRYDDESFSLGFPSEPPPGALVRSDSGASAYGVAVVVHRLGLAIPEGPLDSAVLDIESLPATHHHAVIFRRGELDSHAWLDRFADGYSCGRCVRGGSRDEFEPVACSEMTIVAFDDGDYCDWH